MTYDPKNDKAGTEDSFPYPIRLTQDDDYVYVTRVRDIQKPVSVNIDDTDWEEFEYTNRMCLKLEADTPGKNLMHGRSTILHWGQPHRRHIMHKSRKGDFRRIPAYPWYDLTDGEYDMSGYANKINHTYRVEKDQFFPYLNKKIRRHLAFLCKVESGWLGGFDYPIYITVRASYELGTGDSVHVYSNKIKIPVPDDILLDCYNDRYPD